MYHKYNEDTMITSAKQNKATPMYYKYNGEHNDHLRYTRQSNNNVL